MHPTKPANSPVHRTRLSNGVTVWHDADSNGTLVLEYPDGSRIKATWGQLALFETAVKSLREVYEYLLLRAAGDSQDSCPPVDKLVQLDDLLFALGGPNDAYMSRPGTSGFPQNRSPVL